MIDPEINDFYEESSEFDRLKYGLGPLELERNKELILRHLSNTPSTIIDLGGGPGVYASWLAELGHSVILIDPVKKHIEQSKKTSKSQTKHFECLLGDASKIDYPNNSADLIIVHGPLYHLQDAEDRLSALRECHRKLKPGGLIMAWAITHTASTMVAMIQGILNTHEIYEMCLEELSSGIHEAPENMPGVLAKAFYHRPGQLKDEILEAGFHHINTLPVEGMIWLDKNYFNTRSNEKDKKRMMALLKKTETDPDLLAFSPHIVAIAHS